MSLEIEFINETNNELDDYISLFEQLAKDGLKLLQIDDEIEFSVSIVSSERIHEINRDYRQKDSVTDVITFALEDQDSPFVKGMPRLLGDVFICYDRAVSQANEYQHSIKREMCFLFVHGLLHLLGYDHMNEEDEKRMNELTEEILAIHKIERII